MPDEPAERLKSYPLLVHFGSLCNPLTKEQTQQADFETRINSIGRFMVREVMRFHRTLSPQGKANYSPEDVLLEVWMELRKRNDKYDMNRGGYRTFAIRIIKNTFSEISERARIVRLPSNSASEFQAIKKEDPEANGDHFSKRASMARAGRDHVDINPHSALIQDRLPSPEDGLIWLEEHDRQNSEIADRLSSLTTIECIAVGAMAMIWGDEKTSIAEAARKHGVEPSVLRKAYKTAKSKLLDQYLNSDNNETHYDWQLD